VTDCAQEIQLRVSIVNLLIHVWRSKMGYIRR